MVRPATQRSTPWRTTSTSGNSGTAVPLFPVGGASAVTVRGARADRRPRRLGRLLLGLLLAAPLAVAVLLAADGHDGTEALLVVRAALLHVVLGHAELLGGGQLLQGRLPVEPGA